MKIILFVGGSGLLGETWIKSFNDKFKIYAIKNKNNINVRKKNLIKIKLKNFNYKNLDEIVKKKKNRFDYKCCWSYKYRGMRKE